MVKINLLEFLRRQFKHLHNKITYLLPDDLNIDINNENIKNPFFCIDKTIYDRPHMFKHDGLKRLREYSNGFNLSIVSVYDQGRCPNVPRVLCGSNFIDSAGTPNRPSRDTTTGHNSVNTYSSYDVKIFEYFTGNRIPSTEPPIALCTNVSINLIWQLTLYSAYCSFSIPDDKHRAEMLIGLYILSNYILTKLPEDNKDIYCQYRRRSFGTDVRSHSYKLYEMKFESDDLYGNKWYKKWYLDMYYTIWGDASNNLFNEIEGYKRFFILQGGVNKFEVSQPWCANWANTWGRAYARTRNDNRIDYPKYFSEFTIMFGHAKLNLVGNDENDHFLNKLLKY